MVFTSLPFALFFGAVLLGLLAMRRNDHKIEWLLASGAFFYGYWNWKFLALIGFTSVFDFWLGQQIGAAKGARRKRLLTLDIAVNLGILAIFKYANFFIDSFDALLAPTGLHLGTLHIILPIGISFFVFEAMSYCIDIYRGTLEPYRNWRHFALFIFFFPRMIAGPIIRPADFLPQLERDIRLTPANFYAGAQMFLFGMTKKICIADNLAPFVDVVFQHPERFDALTIVQAVVAYSIQIFCDFSGYSDMALGLAKILGFELPVNFRMPYRSLNVSEFWRRWHISLSSWLRDYLYIPLGGNRRGRARTYLNLFITMCLGGLWHGASWNFVIWGALHGAGLAAHKWWVERGHTRIVGENLGQSPLVPRVYGWAATYIFVCLGWIFFRAQSFGVALEMLNRLTIGAGGAALDGVRFISGPLCVIAPIVIAAHFVGAHWERFNLVPRFEPHRFAHLFIAFSWLIGLFLLCATQAAPFIYFQF